jgi:hypothetical protein
MEGMTTIADAERAQRRVREKFGRLQGVRGIGVTWDEKGNAWIRVNVESRLRDAVSKLVPSEFDGVAIELRSVRDFRSFGHAR